MSTNIDPTGGEPAPPATNPFETWAPVFEDAANLNPYELRQRHDWVGALQDETTHAPTLSQALTDWQYLQPGESLDTVQEALAAYRASQEVDPLDALYQTDPDPDPDPDAMAFPDPHALRQVWQSDQEQMKEALREELRSEWQSQQLAQALEGSMATVAREHSLDDEDRGEVWGHVQQRLAQGNLRADEINTLVETTYTAWDARNQARINKAIAAQQGGGGGSIPEPPGPAGATPTTQQPVTSIKQMARASIERAAAAAAAE